MANLNIEIISPSGVLFKGMGYLATIPAFDGEMGIMRGHETVVATLQAGKIEIYDEKQNLIKALDVVGGFAKQNAEGLLVLVDQAATTVL